MLAFENLQVTNGRSAFNITGKGHLAMVEAETGLVVLNEWYHSKEIRQIARQGLINVSWKARARQAYLRHHKLLDHESLPQSSI